MNGTTQQTANAPAAGTQLTATATCAAGKVLLGGGGLVGTAGGMSAQSVTMTASYPSSTTTWSVTGTVLLSGSGGNKMSVQAFALCSL